MIEASALLFLSVLTVNVLSHSSAVPVGQLTLSGIQSMRQALNSSSFLLITAIFVAITVCDDYEQQTIKHIYARGYSRRQVYLCNIVK
ncbi:MAG: hypothetical protein HFI75_13660 [Lachnospiraceae bacterium]|nr:hypothetical protein [Lachnospiraceae bacterium]